jgi:hypothetical protein
MKIPTTRYLFGISSKCTGTYANQDGSIKAFFVIDDNGNELQILITNDGTVINCVARKQFPADED